MKISHPEKTAFTLIELLVVISIIAILASIASPALIGALKNGKITRATADARQVALALRMYAQDHDGIYPSDTTDTGEEISNANDAYRVLFPAYLQTEKIFAVAGSPIGKSADNNIASPNEVLKAGENHWAYVSGLSTTSNSEWPLVVDHTDGGGTYGMKETEPGGIWGGTKAIVVRADSSASAVLLAGNGDRRYLPRTDNKSKNLLNVTDYMGKGARLLEPVRP
ncbi:MAG: type II secretion system protein [Verrucomicrobiota bacterium]